MCPGQHICCTNMIAKEVIDLYHMGNKGTHKLQMSTKQVKSNVQSLINLTTYTMLHQMKGIGNGWQDV